MADGCAKSAEARIRTARALGLGFYRPHTQAGSSLITNPSVPYESGLARHEGSNVGSNLYDPTRSLFYRIKLIQLSI